MDRLSSRRNSSLRLSGYLLRTMRGRGMHTVTVQSGLQQRWGSHRTILSLGPLWDKPRTPKNRTSSSVPKADPTTAPSLLVATRSAALSLRLLR
jgi:hypothetical protein